MAELIPALNTCLPKMTSGEKRFAQRLQELLEDDYLCWYDIPVGRQRRYPDFIILHPSRGILFLEVKDWRIDTIKSITPDTTDIETSSGLKRVPNPLAQARQYTYQVIQCLESDVLLQQSFGKHQGKLCMPYGYGVVLSSITRKQWYEHLNEHDREVVLQDHLVICKDEMSKSAEAETFQEQLWGMFNYSFGGQLTLPQIDRIRWHLYPEIRINAQKQTGLFDDEEDTSLQESLPDIMKVMDVQQEQLARSMGDGHRVVHGVAGSGKTLILGFRCLYLAEVMSLPILVLCFNITLAAKLRSFIQSKGIVEKVNVFHFHDWCAQQLKTYHVDMIDGDGEVWDRQVDSVISAVTKGRIPRGQYGALLIDEGHDFQAEWLVLVTQMVSPKTDSLLLLYDDAQAIYRKKSTFNFSLASVGIRAQGRTTILRQNYRNTQEILHFAYSFAKEYFSEQKDNDVPLIEPEAIGKNGPKPVMKNFSSLDEEISYVLRCLKKWNSDGRSWKDIALLYPGGEAGKRMYKALTQAKIPHLWAARNYEKKRYNPDEDQLMLVPIPSSKGLEFSTVIVLDAAFLRVDEEENDDISHSVKCLYVGLTRAQENLLVLNHRENALAKMLTEACAEKDASQPSESEAM